MQKEVRRDGRVAMLRVFLQESVDDRFKPRCAPKTAHLQAVNVYRKSTGRGPATK